MSVVSRYGLKKRLIKWIYERYFDWRIEQLVEPRWIIKLDYPASGTPRWGYGLPPHPELFALFSRFEEIYASRLEAFTSLRGFIEHVPRDGAPDSAAPRWRNGFFSALDAIALVGLLNEFKPRLYLEVGSGNSTRFARHAIREFGLNTKIISIDPSPRAVIDGLRDEVLRLPLENVVSGVFDRLDAGDFLFIDNSHRTFMNSDATVVFTEILPRLKPGVIVHIHDIFLPFDYPPDWGPRYYSEQYLFAAQLIGRLGVGGTPEIVLANAYISENPLLREKAHALWRGTTLDEVIDGEMRLMGGMLGTSVWFVSSGFE